MSTSLPIKFAAFMHLAKGQILCVTENMYESLTIILFYFFPWRKIPLYDHLLQDSKHSLEQVGEIMYIDSSQFYTFYMHSLVYIINYRVQCGTKAIS
jgi:hypothetical protein